MRDLLNACDPLPLKLGALVRPVEPVKAAPAPAAEPDHCCTEGDAWGLFQKARAEHPSTVKHMGVDMRTASQLAARLGKEIRRALSRGDGYTAAPASADAVRVFGMPLSAWRAEVADRGEPSCCQRDNPCEGGIDWSVTDDDGSGLTC
jgi:hypothetical protein